MGSKGTFVFVINSSGKVELRPVTTGQWFRSYWIITSGLNEGDIVVGEGVNRIAQGDSVAVQTWMSSTPPEPVKKRKKK